MNGVTDSRTYLPDGWVCYVEQEIRSLLLHESMPVCNARPFSVVEISHCDLIRLPFFVHGIMVHAFRTSQTRAACLCE